MKYLLSLFILAINLIGFSQTPEVLSLSLDNAITLAKQKNTQLLNASLDIKHAKTQVGEVLSKGLPQINGNADFNHTFEVPTQIIPGDFVGQPGTNLAVQFGVPFNANASIGVSQLLFDGTFFLGVKASSRARRRQNRVTCAAAPNTRPSASPNQTDAACGVIPRPSVSNIPSP